MAVQELSRSTSRRVPVARCRVRIDVRGHVGWLGGRPQPPAKPCSKIPGPNSPLISGQLGGALVHASFMHRSCIFGGSKLRAPILQGVKCLAQPAPRLSARSFDETATLQRLSNSLLLVAVADTPDGNPTPGDGIVEIQLVTKLRNACRFRTVRRR